MRTVTIRIGCEGGSWWARSDDMPRWTGVGESLEELRAMLDAAVVFYFDDKPGPFEIVEILEPEQQATQA